MEEEEPHLLHLSRHASASAQANLFTCSFYCFNCVTSSISVLFFLFPRSLRPKHLGQEKLCLVQSLLEFFVAKKLAFLQRLAEFSIMFHDVFPGLGRWWSYRKQSSETQLSRAMVVSAAGTRIAILDGYQIIFLSRVNGFEHKVRSSPSKSIHHRTILISNVYNTK